MIEIFNGIEYMLNSVVQKKNTAMITDGRRDPTGARTLIYITQNKFVTITLKLQFNWYVL